MPDLNAMSTFEKYVQGLSLMTADQLNWCKSAQQGLRQLGISKSLEEVCVRLGVMNIDKLGALLAEIKQKWQISIPRPVISVISDESDRMLQEKLVQQSPQGASQVLECRALQEKAAALGIVLKVTEILVVKGYDVLGGAAPSSAVPVTVQAVEVAADASLDDLLPEAPMPKEELPPYAPPSKSPLGKKFSGAAPLKAAAGPAKRLPGARDREPELPIKRLGNAQDRGAESPAKRLGAPR
jgi:hypothetical protein